MHRRTRRAVSCPWRPRATPRDGPADGPGSVVVTGNTLDATLYAILVTSNCDLSRYTSDDNDIITERFGYIGKR